MNKILSSVVVRLISKIATTINYFICAGSGWSAHYWLRSPGSGDSNAADVNNTGNVNVTGNGVNNTNIGVRPDLLSWPEISSKQFLSARKAKEPLPVLLELFRQLDGLGKLKWDKDMYRGQLSLCYLVLGQL